MRLRLRLFVVLATLVSLVLISTVPVHAQTTAYCSNGTTTSLQSAGVPNLYRLGLQRGVPWQAIATASGITDVTRILPTQLLCVPTNYSTTTTTTTTTVYTPVTTSMTMNMTNVTPVEQPTQTFITPGGYCDALLPGAIPIDRGSCLLELQSIQAGVQSIVQTGITCEPRVIINGTNGNLLQCSVRGDRYLTLPIVIAPAVVP